MSRGFVPWTKEETQKAQEMKRQGHTYSNIAERLNRTLFSIRAHLVRASLTPEELQERERMRTARRTISRKLRPQSHDAGDSSPSLELVNRLLDDRDRRMSVPPRDLTAIYMGDPPVGWSALEGGYQ